MRRVLTIGLATCCAAALAACDAPLIVAEDGGMPRPDTGGSIDAQAPLDGAADNRGTLCAGNPAICSPGLVCSHTWYRGDVLACMKPCTDDSECGLGFCHVPLESGPDAQKFCTIPCDPLDPVGSCAEGTICILGRNDLLMYSTHCADWPTGSRVQNAICGPGMEACAVGLDCYTTDGGTSYRCTAICNAGEMTGCPTDWFCQPNGTVHGVTYGNCVPPGLVWPAPP